MDGSKQSDLESLRVARYGLNAGWVEELRERFRIDPHSVDPAWAEHFEDPLASDALELPVAEASRRRTNSARDAS